MIPSTHQLPYYKVRLHEARAATKIGRVFGRLSETQYIEMHRQRRHVHRSIKVQKSKSTGAEIVRDRSWKVIKDIVKGNKDMEEYYQMIRGQTVGSGGITGQKRTHDMMEGVSFISRHLDDDVYADGTRKRQRCSPNYDMDWVSDLVAFTLNTYLTFIMSIRKHLRLL